MEIITVKHIEYVAAIVIFWMHDRFSWQGGRYGALHPAGRGQPT